MDDRFHMQQIVDFSKSDSFSFLMNDFDKNIFEKFKIMLDKEGREELYSYMQGMKELLRLIQGYENKLMAPDYE